MIGDADAEVEGVIVEEEDGVAGLILEVEAMVDIEEVIKIEVVVGMTGDEGEVDLVVDGFDEIVRALETRGEERRVWQH